MPRSATQIISLILYLIIIFLVIKGIRRSKLRKAERERAQREAQRAQQAPPKAQPPKKGTGSKAKPAKQPKSPDVPPKGKGTVAPTPGKRPQNEDPVDTELGRVSESRLPTIIASEIKRFILNGDLGPITKDPQFKYFTVAIENGGYKLNANFEVSKPIAVLTSSFKNQKAKYKAESGVSIDDEFEILVYGDSRDKLHARIIAELQNFANVSISNGRITIK